MKWFECKFCFTPKKFRAIFVRIIGRFEMCAKTWKSIEFALLEQTFELALLEQTFEFALLD
jgi:hypothetical protein